MQIKNPIQSKTIFKALLEEPHMLRGVSRFRNQTESGHDKLHEKSCHRGSREAALFF